VTHSKETEMSIDTEVADVAGFSGARLARIDNFFNVEVARGAVPGAVLHVERAGEVVMRRVWGYRNRAAGTPMTTDSIFRIYSMTKPMVSFVTLMLAAEGRLYLDQPIADFVPAFAYVRVLADDGRVAPRRAPTIHDLLRQTAGLVYERNGGPVAELYAGLMDGDPTNEAFADRIARLPLAHQPGTVWEYSHATDVLGRVVEVAAGRSLSPASPCRATRTMRASPSRSRTIASARTGRRCSTRASRAPSRRAAWASSRRSTTTRASATCCSRRARSTGAPTCRARCCASWRATTSGRRPA
jgi:CubicO group peptidase (beta-lactamase class C family)